MRSAAREKEPVSATATKASKWRSEIAVESSMGGGDSTGEGSPRVVLPSARRVDFPPGRARRPGPWARGPPPIPLHGKLLRRARLGPLRRLPDGREGADQLLDRRPGRGEGLASPPPPVGPLVRAPRERPDRALRSGSEEGDHPLPRGATPGRPLDPPRGLARDDPRRERAGGPPLLRLGEVRPEGPGRGEGPVGRVRLLLVGRQPLETRGRPTAGPRRQPLEPAAHAGADRAPDVPRDSHGPLRGAPRSRRPDFPAARRPAAGRQGPEHLEAVGLAQRLRRPGARSRLSLARPRPLLLLPRLGGGDRQGRRADRRGRRGALQPPQARPRLPRPRDRVLPEGGGDRRGRPRLRRLLREALRQVRAHPPLRAPDLPEVLEGLPRVDAHLAHGQALGEGPDPRAPQGRPQARAVRRPPHVPRGLRLLLLPLRGGGDPHGGRGRGVVDGDDGGREGLDDPDRPGDALPPLRRPPLLRLHRLLRVRGERGGIQADGDGSLREAEARREGEGGREDRERRLDLARHVLLLLPLVAGLDAVPQVHRPLRARPRPRAGRQDPRPLLRRRRRLHPGGDGGDPDRDGAPPPPADGPPPARHGRGVRLELRRERQDPAGHSVQGDLRPARRRGRRRRGRRGAVGDPLPPRPAPPVRDGARLLGEGVRGGRDPRLPQEGGDPACAMLQRRAGDRPRRRDPPERGGHRLVRRAVRVGAARARPALDPRGSAARGDEGRRQREDQVPRGVPPLRPLRARREGARVLRPRGAGQALPRPLHALRRPRPGGEAGRHPRDHPRRRDRAPPGGALRDLAPLPPADLPVRGGDRGPRPAQHLLQPEGGADRHDPRERLPDLHALGDGPPRPQEHPRLQGRREVVKKVAALLVGVFVLLLVLEGGLRMAGLAPQPRINRFHPTLGWEKEPGRTSRKKTSEFDVTFAINERGLRGPVVPYEKAADESRIVFAGDSFCLGYTVEEKDLFLDILGERLRAEGRNLSVVNGGTEGYSTDQEALWFRDEGVRYAPDVAILCFYPNDVFWCGEVSYLRYPKPLLGDDGAPTNLPLVDPGRESWV